MVALVLAVGASFCLGWVISRNRHERPPEKPDTTYIERWVHDTVTEYVSKPGKPIYVYLPVHDTTQVHDTTTLVDSVLVEVPIEERTYTGENYRAVVTGFQPELKDIWVKEKEVIVKVPYRRKWDLIIGPQAGVGITPKGWQPYAGIGVTFGYSF